MEVDAKTGTSVGWGMIGGLTASLIVALISTWLAAEANRTEALRQDRRAAYAELLATAQDCETAALFRGYQFPQMRLPPLDEIRKLSPNEAGTLYGKLASTLGFPPLDELRRLSPKKLGKLFSRLEKTNLAKYRGTLRRYRDCSIPLRTIHARISLLTQNDAIIQSSHRLTLATLARVAAEPQQKRWKTEKVYIRALARFQALGQQDATAPVISPLLIQLAGLTIIYVLLLILTVSLLRRRYVSRQ